MYDPALFNGLVYSPPPPPPPTHTLTHPPAQVAENMLKSSVLGQDVHGISAVKPDEYANRFTSVLSGWFEIETDKECLDPQD
jgi:hypothetical protein